MVCGLCVEHAYDIFITGYLFFLTNPSLSNIWVVFYMYYICIKVKRTSLNKYLCILSLFKTWDRSLNIEFSGQNIQAFDANIFKKCYTVSFNPKQ